jgi:DNA (cytosine-5)-methyltransferase 1
MGLPEGHVTDPAIWDGWKPGAARDAQLKALGNGVVVQQIAAGIRLAAARATGLDSATLAAA